MSKTENLKQKMGLTVHEEAKTALQKATVKNTLVGLNRNDLTKVFQHMQANIEQALPKHITGERMVQIIVTMLDKNPAIRECEVSSIVGTIMQASILGFKPIDALGQVYFVPYKQRDGKKLLTLQIGYKGYIDLARRSGQIKMLYAEIVRVGDTFDYEVGLEPKLVHKPTGDSSKPMTHVYAVAHYLDGGYNFIVLTKEEVEKLRKRNPMQGATPSSAWLTDYDKMAKGKAIKQLATYMPLSEEMQTAVSLDEAAVQLQPGGGLVESFTHEEVPFEIYQEVVDTETGELNEGTAEKK